MAGIKSIAIGCTAVTLSAGVVAACIVGGIFFLGLTGVADKATQEGVEFGKSTDQQGCQDEALRRLRAALKSHDLIKRREAQVFTYGCFQSCAPTSGYCANAPKRDAFRANLGWSESQCEKEGIGDDDACSSVFMEVVGTCLGKTPRSQR
jgi:hypothetical protein